MEAKSFGSIPRNGIFDITNKIKGDKSYVLGREFFRTKVYTCKLWTEWKFISSVGSDIIGC
jgi:hypothetical protein